MRKWDKRIGNIIFLCYILFLIRLIIFKMSWTMVQNIWNDWSVELLRLKFQTANFSPFKTITMYIKYWSSGGMRPFDNLVGNIVVFVPMGVLLPQVWQRARNVFVCLGCGILFTAGIEIVQLLTLLGSMDIDDVILNCSGILVGYILQLVFRKIIIKEEKNT